MHAPSGWVLVESHLGRSGRPFSSRLLVQRRSSPSRAEEIRLPVLPDGRIQELVRLPDDVAAVIWQPPDNGRAEAPRLTIRRIGWLERAWHMTNRVVRTYARLSGDQRRESGLFLRRLLYDLPGVYRTATEFRVHYPPSNYSAWIERFDTFREHDIFQIRAHIARFAARPHFHLLLLAGEGGSEAVQRTLASLRGQLYPGFTCSVLDHAGALDASASAGFDLDDLGTGSRVVAQETLAGWLAEFKAALAAGPADEWVMLLRAGDVLPAHALYWFACEAQARPDAAIVYSDDDTLDAAGSRRHPRFKPDWSLAHLRSTNYVGEAAILRGRDVAAAGGVSLDCCRHGNYDLLLRVADHAGERVAHVPAVLLHRGEAGGRARPAQDAEGEACSAWSQDALRRHLARCGAAADVTQTLPGCWRVRHHLPVAPPPVSIIVPTRDKRTLLARCVESVLEKTTYSRFEILVVDNRSADPAALAYLAKIAGHPAVRVLRHDRPFNYSAINNFAARHAQGEVLCLLNNDAEVISPDWLEEMVGHLLQQQVGVVGAKLYYPDGRVQHAGVTVGPGSCASHLHTDLMRGEPGYCDRAVVAQEFSAVTAACLVTWKGLYERLGGLNEKRLSVAFNDVDYCLRAQEAGYRVIFTPHAELYHHESATRGLDVHLRKRLRATRELRYMRARWRKRMRHDPYYNPNLSYRRPDFSLSEAPLVKKPWVQSPPAAAGGRAPKPGTRAVADSPSLPGR